MYRNRLLTITAFAVCLAGFSVPAAGDESSFLDDALSEALAETEQPDAGSPAAADPAQPQSAPAEPASESAPAESGQVDGFILMPRVFRLEHANAAEVAERFNETWSGDFGGTWKVSKIAQAFPEANAVMVTAPKAVLDACEEAVRQLDVDVPQVYIEARFVELANNASHKLGIDWQMLDGMKASLSLDAGLNERKVKGVSTYTSADSTYTISSDGGRSTANLSYVNATLGMSDLYLILRALESSEDARTFSNPKIIVSSGKKATVDMTTKYPNVKISAKRTTNSGGDSLDLDMQMAAIPGEDKLMFAKEAFFSWGIALDVTPRIGTNGLINVQIVPTISSRSDWVVSGTSSDESDGGTISAKYPVIDVQRLVTEFNMASGTTAVIGGLSLTVETQKDNGIPFLRDIWWIGPRLFGSKIRVKEQREIVVFVTVGLVDPHHVEKDAALPRNAVLGRQYVEGVRREPGERRRRHVEGLDSLDLRPLEEQYNDPTKRKEENNQ
ncbi:MAG: hypothetical protein K6F50_00750 [Kiritimatiellae bacterium]|nr:hypothetical protein [Kiritimatiellia bacterium]